MTDLLEVPEIRRQAYCISVERYHRLTEGLRTELLRGTIIEKMSKSPLHSALGHRLREILAKQITSEFVAFHERPITAATSESEPDVIVVRGAEEAFWKAHPRTAELAVEVAVTSLEIDRVKAEIYAEAGVKEYWIVRPPDRQVEVYRQPSARGYGEKTTVAAPAVLHCAALPGVRVDLAALFA